MQPLRKGEVERSLHAFRDDGFLEIWRTCFIAWRRLMVGLLIRAGKRHVVFG
jgi:hypothetical protein